MLMLSRKLNETIRIGDVVITVVEFRGQKRVVLGIDAPPGVVIARGELPPRAAVSELPGHEPELGGES